MPLRELYSMREVCHAVAIARLFRWIFGLLRAENDRIIFDRGRPPSRDQYRLH